MAHVSDLLGTFMPLDLEAFVAGIPIREVAAEVKAASLHAV